MMLEKLDRYMVISMFIFVLILSSKTCFALDDIENKKAIKSGYYLVETFYTCLTSEKMPDICNELFDTTPYKETEVKSIWSYYRNNKRLFITKTNTVKDANFFKWARKSVTYFNPHDIDKSTDGQLYISVIHTLPGRNKSGVFKEISFPIGKNEFGEYKIIFGNIKINGILLDYENSLIRDFDIIKTLGFKNSRGGVSRKK